MYLFFVVFYSIIKQICIYLVVTFLFSFLRIEFVRNAFRGLMCFLVRHLVYFYKRYCWKFFNRESGDIILISLASSVKLGAKVFWDDITKNIPTKDQIIATFLGFCICLPFFGLAILSVCSPEEDLERFSFMCFLCFFICNATIPIISIRNDVRSVGEPSYKNLEKGKSFLHIYLFYLDKKSFVYQVIFNSLGLFFVLIQIKTGNWCPRSNNTFVEFFVRRIAWAIITASLRKITGTYGLKAGFKKSELSIYIEKVPRFLSDEYWAHFRIYHQESKLSSFLFTIFCMSKPVIFILCTLWELKCYFVGLYAVYHFQSWPDFFVNKMVSLMHLVAENPDTFVLFKGDITEVIRKYIWKNTMKLIRVVRGLF